MSKISVVSYMSLNGMTSSNADGDVTDWLPYESSLDAVYIDAYRDADAVLFGRKSFEALRSYWPTSAAANEPAELTRLINDMPKIVFSRTLRDPAWSGSRVESDLSRERIEALKREYPKGLLAIGSGKLVSQLAEQDLVDDLCLIIAPIVLADGNPYFAGLRADARLSWVSATPHGNGNLVVRYSRA